MKFCCFFFVVLVLAVQSLAQGGSKPIAIYGGVDETSTGEALRVTLIVARTSADAGNLTGEARTGEMTVFLAHLPAAVLADPLYQRCNGASGIEGWMEEGALGLFGTNALRTHPHPEGDGLLLIGSCV